MVTYVRDGLIEKVWRKVLGDIVYVPLYRPINPWALRADLDLPIGIMGGGHPEFRDARYTTPRGELGTLSLGPPPRPGSRSAGARRSAPRRPPRPSPRRT